MRRRGFALLEVMIVTGILGIILGSIMLSLRQGSDQVAYQLSRDELDASLQTVIERLGEALQNARIDAASGIAADGSWISYQVPVDQDGDGDALDDSYNVTWGVIRGLGPTGRHIAGATGRIAFVGRPDGAVLSEEMVNRNLNANTETAKDMTDVFDLGGFVLTSSESPDSPLRLGGAFFLQPSGGRGGDVDGDGAPDPIFELSGEQLIVRLWAGRTPIGGPPIFVGREVRILLRNQD